MSKRFSWPHFRTDLLGVASLVVVATCLANGEWPAVVIFTLGVALICAISPRMKGPFEISSGRGAVKGFFDDAPGSKAVEAEVIGEGQDPSTEDWPQPSSREPDED